MGKTNAIANFIYFSSAPAFAVLFGFALSLGTVGALVCGFTFGIASRVSLLIAKAPALRSGRLFTFGASSVPPQRRWLWWAAWALLAVSTPFFAASALIHVQF